MPDKDLVFVSNDELEHYGVKGMKWGVRKKIMGGLSLGRDKAKRNLSREGRVADGKAMIKNSKNGDARSAYSGLIGKQAKAQAITAGLGFVAIKAMPSMKAKVGMSWIAGAAVTAVAVRDINRAVKVRQAQKSSQS